MANSRPALHLLYHELTSVSVVNTYQMQLEMFRAHLDELLHIQAAGGIEPRITFDDGHRSNYELALPSLEQRGLKATFFITAGWTGDLRGDYMSWNDLRSLHAAGHCVGAHGWSHKLMTHCNTAELQRELIDTKAALEDHIGSPVSLLSFPGGRANKRVIQAALDAGYSRLYSSIPRAEMNPHEQMVGRVNVKSNWDVPYLRSLFAQDQSALTKLRRQSALKDVAKTVLGDRLYEKLWSAINGKQIEQDSVAGSRQ